MTVFIGKSDTSRSVSILPFLYVCKTRNTMKELFLTKIDLIRGGSRAAATSKMDCFLIIVNGFQPLTIITKHSILDVAAALDPPLLVKILAPSTLLFSWLQHTNAG